MSKKRFLILLLLAFVLFSHVALRMLVSQVGYNPDAESWFLVGEGVTQGNSVYTVTHRYNYGPIWSYVINILFRLTSIVAPVTIQNFHLVLAAFFGVIDIALAFLVYKIYGKIPALIFLLNPISILISGYHSQFENFALLFAFISWYFYLEHKKRHNFKLYLFSAVFLGLSLATKHILLFFPFWLLLHHEKSILSYVKKAFYCFIAYSIFAGFFVFEIVRFFSNRANVLNGIKMFVFDYKSAYGNSAFVKMTEVVVNPQLIKMWLANTPVFQDYMFIFVVIVLLAGFLYRKYSDPKMLMPLYLLFFFVFSPAIADQQLVIPLVTLAIFYNNIASLAYFSVGFLYLAMGPSANISNFLDSNLAVIIGNRMINVFPWRNAPRFTDLNTHALALIALLLSFITLGIPTWLKAQTKYIYYTFFVLAFGSIFLFSYTKVVKSRASDKVSSVWIKEGNLYWTCGDSGNLEPVFYTNYGENIAYIDTTAVVKCPAFRFK